MNTLQRRSIRVHATNIRGLGALQLFRSLLPALNYTEDYHVETLYLPARGELTAFTTPVTTRIIRQKRLLPNPISRVLECTVFADQFEGDGDLLVLGDIPLRCRGRQTVFVQSPLLTGADSRSRFGTVKYLIAKVLFHSNSRFVSAFIVQTAAMKNALSETYPDIASRIHIISQPPPEWLLLAKLKRVGPVAGEELGLELVYPAANYPHKNHKLLAGINHEDMASWPVSNITLTVDQALHPNAKIQWIRCVGQLAPNDMVNLYKRVDGLLFLSISESFGFPLVEAMWVGLPIVCPDLPYARALCGDEAIYFDPNRLSSLHTAVCELKRRLTVNWWPDWRRALAALPHNWTAVAIAMLQVTTGQAQHLSYSERAAV